MKKSEKNSPEIVDPGRPGLADICSGVFTLILHLRKTADFGDREILRRRVRHLLDQAETDANHAGYASEDVHQALFALIAFLDESIIASDWAEKEAWLAKPLQLEYFDRFDAGEEFFAKLEKLRQRPRAMSHVLEVYHLCMALGFRGKYQVLERERIRTLIEETYEELSQVRSRSPVALSPHGLRGDEFVDVVTREVPFWVVAVFAAAAGFFFYLTMTVLNAKGVRQVIQAMEFMF